MRNATTRTVRPIILRELKTGPKDLTYFKTVIAAEISLTDEDTEPCYYCNGDTRWYHTIRSVISRLYDADVIEWVKEATYRLKK